MRRTLMLAVATAALALAGTASASDEGYYVSGNGGVTLPPNLTLKSNTLGNMKENTGTGYTYGASAGYDFGTGWRVQFNSQYTYQSVDRLNGAATNGHVSSTSLMLGAQKDLTNDSVVTPYVGAGIGLQNVGGEVGPYRGRAWKPAYQAQAGLRGDLSRDVSLFGEYRFTQSESASMRSATDLAHQHFANHGLMLGMSYKLGN